jgi:hypothetical protein
VDSVAGSETPMAEAVWLKKKKRQYVVPAAWFKQFYCITV